MVQNLFDVLILLISYKKEVIEFTVNMVFEHGSASRLNSLFAKTGPCTTHWLLTRLKQAKVYEVYMGWNSFSCQNDVKHQTITQ